MTFCIEINAESPKSHRDLGLDKTNMQYTIHATKTQNKDLIVKYQDMALL